MLVKENEEVTFICQVDKGVPPGELAWVMNGDVISVEKNESSHTWKYNFTRNDQASEITCKLKYVTLSQPESSCDEVIRIMVQYGPTVDIKNGSHGVVVEDRRYEALCDVDANPDAAVYWQHPSGDTTTGGRLLLENVTRDKGGEYKCFANTTFWDNSTASSEESHFLDVQYEPSVIIRNGLEGVAVEGRMYEALCDVDANPAAVVYWQHPSGDTTADETLLLDSVSRQQRGEYKCFANNTFWDNSTASSKESHFLDVQFPPAVAVIPEVPRKLGESVQLRCHAIEANPPDVDYTWYLANGDIFSNATVEITNITRDLHGDQSCTANNTYHDGTYGTGSNVTVLDVQYPPAINNSKVESKEKDTVVLTCNVDSNPYPSEFQWTNDDVLLSNESTYTINDVTRDAAGNYTCTVTTVFYDNTNATDQGVVDLRVQYLSSVNITILPSSINEGDDVDIHCKASDGNPDSHKIELIFKDETLARNDSQELHHEITDISPGNSGSYSCRAFTNFYDGTVNYSVTKEELVVYYSARLAPSDEKEFKVEIGDVVDINCTAHGMPVPSIKWFDCNDREISKEDDNFEIRNHQPIGNVVTSILSVTLADSTYYGEYVCEATNADDVIGDRQSTTIIELITDNGSDPLIAVITVSVLVLIILIVIIVAIVVCKKRRSKEQNGQSLG
ncbi:B-cell receptor CD22-like [Ptychodera flava]|uniref:B-cell receptor CD22-like n=1 Tax=Ptychodera flava TaxID=63121 RepID=UPI00396A9144